MTDNQQASAASIGEQIEKVPSLGYRVFFLVLMILLSASIVSSRYVIYVLVEPIRNELHLNDKQISAVKDLAFVGVYILAALPLARLADNWSRRYLISIAAVIWGGASLICGMASNFFVMLVGRGAIGLGEATFSAPTQALIADVFPVKHRGTAISIFLLGATLGNWIAPAFGSWAAHAHGWRWAYMATAIPAFILAPIAWLFIRDVRRGLSDGIKAQSVVSAPFKETAKMLLSIRSFVMLIMASGLNALLSVGLVTWMPAFLDRTHHMPIEKVGASMGAALFFGTLIGHSLGGPVTDYLARRDQRWYLWVAMMTGAISATIGYFMLSGPVSSVFILLFLQFCISGLSAAPLMAAIAALAPASARATASAIMFIVINIIGFGLGPFLVATVSDALHQTYGESSLQIAMELALLLAIPSTFMAWIGSRHFTQDAKNATDRLAASQ